jgi:hypothetical protein
LTQYRFDGCVRNAIGQAIPGVEVYVCTQPLTSGAGVVPPTPLATLYADSAGATPLANPVLTDGNGNFFFYTATGFYTLVYFDPFDRITTTFFPDQVVLAPGGGSVTSVAMTGDGVVQNSVVPGSPINSSGTLAPTARSVPANTVVAGPASGGAAPLTVRALVAADLPSGTIFGTVVVAFNAIPTFNAAAFSWPTFLMTLTGNVTSSAVSNPFAGQYITFVITQDGTGGRTFAWPANFKGASAIAPEASSVSVQTFCYDGAAWRATGAGSTTGS